MLKKLSKPFVKPITFPLRTIITLYLGKFNSLF
jgi:hypothetical protein